MATKKAATGLYIGTSGWGYPSWKPEFYPPEIKSKDFLRYYSSQLNATEVNYTFRRAATEKALRQWLSETPNDFHFVLKANQYITHIRRLKNTEEPVERFFTSIQPMVESRRMGAVFFQLPPNFKADVPRLRDFLASLPNGVRYAWEFRHDTWFTDETYEALADYDSALCIAENETMTTPNVLTASFAYYRFRKSRYSRPRLKQIASDLRGLATKREVYAFFKHEEDPKSATWAMAALKMASALS
jgi:uncharacterized protein YecE (DUF72 family)